MIISDCTDIPHLPRFIPFLSSHSSKMNRPRRAAAAKPQGHYAATTSPAKRRKASDSASASARKKGKQKAQPQPLLDGIGLPMPGPVPAVPIPVITPAPLDPAALALDLNKSYEGKITPPVRPKRQPRWQQPAANPIIRIENTPNGWNDKEPDLDPEYVFSAHYTYIWGY